MADTIRDVTIRVSIKNGDVSLKVPDFAPASASIKSASDGLVDVAKMAGTVKEKTKGAADELDRLKNLDTAKAKALGVGDSLKQTGEGAFTLARGMAFLLTSTDDGFTRMVANIAKVQGAFDLFKGSFETVKGLTEATAKLKAMVAAASAATDAGVANTVSTAVGTGVTIANTRATEANIVAIGAQATVTGAATTATVANAVATKAAAGSAFTAAAAFTTLKVATMALYTALGPVTVAALAVAAVGLAVYKGWQWFTGGDAEDSADKMAEGLSKVRKEALQLSGALQDAPGLSKNVSDNSDAGKRSAEFEDKKTESLREQAKLQGVTFNFQKRRLELQSEAQKIEARSFRAAEELSKWTEHATETAQLDVNIQAARLEFRTRMAELSKQELESVKATGTELTKQKTDQENLLKTTKEKIKAEQDALLSAEAKFGQLTKREQKRVTDIAGRGGPASKSEAELVQKAGFDQAGTKFFAQRGRDGGFEQASKGLGGKTSEDLKKLETERAQIEARLESVKNTLASNQRRQLELLDEVVTQLEDATQMGNRLDQLERKLLMREARKAASKQ